MNTRIQGEAGSIATAHAMKLKSGKNTLELLVAKSTIHTWHDPLCMQRLRSEIPT